MPDHAPSTLAIFAWALPVILLFSIAELFWLTWVRRIASFRSDFLQPLKNLFFVLPFGAVFGRLLPIISVAALANVGYKLSPLELPSLWYGWAVALLIYEFWYWVQHFLAHKVRLLWCIHAPHHAPNTINMLVGTNHHVVESQIYFPFFLGFLPGLCGVAPVMVVAINLLDGIWGSCLHVSPQVVRGRYGPLEFFMQTPSYHRVHHAKNIRYMDSNYNSITLFWDVVMRTKVNLTDAEPVDYGITRAVDVASWRDVQFGEFSALCRDMRSAPGILSKAKYLLMPPGWSHTGDHKTVAVQREAWLSKCAREN